MNRRKKQNNDNKMLNKAIRFSIIFLLLFAGSGSLIIYRTKIPEKKFTPIYGKLEKIETKKEFGKYGRNYAILFGIKGVENIYGIYGGTKDQAIKKENKMNLNIGDKYTFLIDNSVVNTFDNINLGVRVIKKENKTVYKESVKAEFWFGIIFIITGIISSTLFYYFGKRKFGK
jgi:hypothetical protein